MINLMTLTNVLPIPATSPRARKTASDAMRQRALERLYERKAAVDHLIESLECYQRCRAVRSTPGIPLTAMPRCS